MDKAGLNLNETTENLVGTTWYQKYLLKPNKTTLAVVLIIEKDNQHDIWIRKFLVLKKIKIMRLCQGTRGWFGISLFERKKRVCGPPSSNVCYIYTCKLAVYSTPPNSSSPAYLKFLLTFQKEKKKEESNFISFSGFEFSCSIGFRVLKSFGLFLGFRKWRFRWFAALRWRSEGPIWGIGSWVFVNCQVFRRPTSVLVKARAGKTAGFSLLSGPYNLNRFDPL